MMIIDCISDLHGHYPQLEGGDLLIVCGDLTARDAPHEYNQFARWIRSFPYKKRIVIGGNHDNWIIESGCLGIEEAAEIGDFQYLCDSGTEFEGLKIWGSPWTKTFPGMNPHCKAFTVDTEEELAEKWALIPEDTDILITHSPAWGIQDGPNAETRYGSTSLLRWIAWHAYTLQLHVAGHIHEGYGKFHITCADPRIPVYVNASHMNERYEPVNKPIRIEL